MTAITSRTSVPQIWINQKHVGGCDDLKVIEKLGYWNTQRQSLTLLLL